MTRGADGVVEIESFNLADLDVTAMDARLELTGMIPACTLIICGDNCTHNCTGHCVTACIVDTCGVFTGCQVFS